MGLGTHMYLSTPTPKSNGLLIASSLIMCGVGGPNHCSVIGDWVEGS